MPNTEPPEYRYFPKIWMERYGPRAWARIRFRHACRTLGIPEEKWPPFEVGTYNRFPIESLSVLPSFTASFELPAFDFINESVTEWRKRANAKFRNECDVYIQRCVAGVDEIVARGIFGKVSTVRDKNTPIELRYEWAARRYCLRTPFKVMATDSHDADKIRKAVAKVFEDVGVKYRK